MNEHEIAQYILNTFEYAETSEKFGYTFFFYGTDHRLPFATLIGSDNEYDRISNLDRPGVYRLNIGVRKQTFQSLFGADTVDAGAYDYTALDTVIPHPEYAAQSFICVLNPGDATLDKVREYLAEAYEISRARAEKHARAD